MTEEYPYHSHHLGGVIKNADEEYCYNCHMFAINTHPYSIAERGECRLNRPICDGASWRIVKDVDWCPDFKKREGKRRGNYGR
jgi:hypothetical protein